MSTEEVSRRRAALVADMTTRLRPVCAHWPEDDFVEMIHRLAEITMKFESGDLTTRYDRRETDRLLAEIEGTLKRGMSERDADKS
jgi:hypothetical protein